MHVASGRKKMRIPGAETNENDKKKQVGSVVILMRSEFASLSENNLSNEQCCGTGTGTRTGTVGTVTF